MITQLKEGRKYNVYYPGQNNNDDNNKFIELIRITYTECQFETFIAMAGLSNIQFVEVIKDVE